MSLECIFASRFCTLLVLYGSSFSDFCMFFFISGECSGDVVCFGCNFPLFVVVLVLVFVSGDVSAHGE